MSTRLRLALEAGAVRLPEDGPVAVLMPPADVDLTALAAGRAQIVQGFRPDHDHWNAQDHAVYAAMDDVPNPPAAAILFLPRAKDAARATLARALDWDCPVIVDGLKGDGIDSLYKALRGRADVSAAFSKAHGKAFQVSAGARLDDWRLPALTPIADGWMTAPGIFSADGPDPGSVALAEALPPLKGRVADLGAGWGYLSCRALQTGPGITRLDMVEADHAALQAARANVTDPRAQAHWADATTWRPEALLDHVITNPPFHVSRRAEPALGAAFIAAAARMLAPRGTLWLVANRHLPYEQDLERHFAEIAGLPGPSGYKLIRASRPRKTGSRR